MTPIVKLPYGEDLLYSDSFRHGADFSTHVTVRIETNTGCAAAHSRMLSYQVDGEQIVKPCSYRVPERPANYIRVIILRGADLVHTTRGVLRIDSSSKLQFFKPEDFEPFISVAGAAQYALDWINDNLNVVEMPPLTSPLLQAIPA